MDDPSVGFNDEEINVEEIMKKIRENIRIKKEAGVLSPNYDKKLALPHHSSTYSPDITVLHSLSDTNRSSYVINSHRHYLGLPLIKGRQLINGEVKRYVDPLILKQCEWNRFATGVLQSENDRISEVETRISEVESLIHRGAISEKVQKTIQEEFMRQMKGILHEAGEELQSLSTFQRIMKSHESDIPLDSHPSPNLPIHYLDFENRFRGSREDIKTRQDNFLPFFSGCSHVLDIGCGRGELLELLRENGIGATGIDIDTNMVEYCHSIGLDVTLHDAITYLTDLKDESLDGVFIDQVVEHVDPSYLIQLLHLCAQKMMSGSTIVIETVNPLSFFSHANFYLDLSHLRPVHPATLQYLINDAGFEEIGTLYLSVVSQEKRLKEIHPSLNEMPEEMGVIFQVYNQNIRKINSILFGAQDYVVIGKKSASFSQ